MKLLELTLDSPQRNVALDEALLCVADEDRDSMTQYLRIWESPTPAVVLGRSSRIHSEVNFVRCQELEVPVVRRSSGGGTVVIGPGCLMYSIVLHGESDGGLVPVKETHDFVLGQLSSAFCRAGYPVAQAGISDLVTDESVLRKVSGNSMKCRRRSLLYHGTILYDFDLSLIANLLQHPPRRPAYRQQRAHLDFVTNINVRREAVVDLLKGLWSPLESTQEWPEKRTRQLVDERFGRTEWTMAR